MTIGLMEEKSCKRKQQEKMLDGLTKGLNVGQLIEALKAARDRDPRKVIIAYLNEQGT